MKMKIYRLHLTTDGINHNQYDFKVKWDAYLLLNTLESDVTYRFEEITLVANEVN